MTKAEIKQIKQLQQKKYRQEYKQFIVEGWKSIRDFILSGYKPVKIYATTEKDDAVFLKSDFEIISSKILQQISALKNPNDMLAVFSFKTKTDLPESGLILSLDNLQDPGNLGTIIRTADWFGIKNIVCSLGTVDCYNPKVVQASMGSLARVQVFYTDLPKYLSSLKIPVYGTFLEGENIYQSVLPDQAAIVIGNEGQGISTQTAECITRKITIPKAPTSAAESLNASVATAIVINEFKRKSFL